MTHRTPLDTYDMKPKGMTNYLRYNGWHFNKKMCEWAVGQLKKYDTSTEQERPVKFVTKEKVDEILKAANVELENNTGYDYVFVANMAASDYYGSSIEDEKHLAMFIMDVIDDIDQADGFIFNRFYADCVHNGTPIPWDDVL